jgi:diacylglycerol kinase family enzyme
MLGVAAKQVKKMRGVHVARATRVDFCSSIHAQIDGEYVGTAPSSFEIVPDALTLLIPESYG